MDIEDVAALLPVIVPNDTPKVSLEKHCRLFQRSCHAICHRYAHICAPMKDEISFSLTWLFIDGY